MSEQESFIGKQSRLTEIGKIRLEKFEGKPGEFFLWKMKVEMVLKANRIWYIIEKETENSNDVDLQLNDVVKSLICMTLPDSGIVQVWPCNVKGLYLKVLIYVFNCSGGLVYDQNQC